MSKGRKDFEGEESETDLEERGKLTKKEARLVNAIFNPHNA